MAAEHEGKRCVLDQYPLRIRICFRWNTGVQFRSLAQSCPTLCDPMDCSIPGFPVHHQLPELAQTQVHRVVMPSNTGVSVIFNMVLFKMSIPEFFWVWTWHLSTRYIRRLTWSRTRCICQLATGLPRHRMTAAVLDGVLWVPTHHNPALNGRLATVYFSHPPSPAHWDTVNQSTF